MRSRELDRVPTLALFDPVRHIGRYLMQALKLLFHGNS
jgi:hypothetical protein